MAPNLKGTELDRGGEAQKKKCDKGPHGEECNPELVVAGQLICGTNFFGAGWVAGFRGWVFGSTSR
jgi:hypothetical protein